MVFHDAARTSELCADDAVRAHWQLTERIDPRRGEFVGGEGELDSFSSVDGAVETNAAGAGHRVAAGYDDGIARVVDGRADAIELLIEAGQFFYLRSDVGLRFFHRSEQMNGGRGGTGGVELQSSFLLEFGKLRVMQVEFRVDGRVLE